jgi:outer membrane protein OmpA-like peptidoglycan-associated protein
MHYYNNENHVIQEWKTTEAVHKNKANTLKVQRNFNEVKFFINDELVHISYSFNYWGSKFGFLVAHDQTVKVDHFKLSASPKVIKTVENAIQGRKKEDLGPNVNSPYTEIQPLVSYDGKTLYFVRKDHPENMSITADDAWYCTLDASGNWTKAQNFGAPVNNKGDNGIRSISPDQNTILVINAYKPTGELAGQGLSISRRTANGWQLPKKIEIKEFKNKNKYVDYFMASDNKTLLLSIDNEKTVGEKDIFVSFLQADSTFSAPLNLGSVVNSTGDEFGASLAADGKTLYFNSYGHQNYGSADIFMSKRLDDSWTKWSEPLNLGPEINSKEWEGVLCIPANGDYAYLSSHSNNGGKTDIFRIRMTKETKPEPVVYIHGKVLNKKTNEPLSASIRYHDLKDNKEIGTAVSNPTDGSYKIILPLGKVYSFLAEKTAFYSVSDNMDVTTLGEYKEIERNLYLAPLEEGETILLNNIFFEFDKADIKPESYSELDRLAQILTENPSLKIDIAGHTDDKGADDYNKSLSQSRVNSVLNYLTKKGIKPERLTATGHGESKPLVPNASDEHRAKNRRVEFVILKKL